VLQARIGDRLRVRELLRLLVAESDNIAAMRLLDFVGLDDVNQTMRGMGLRGTRLQNWRASGVYGGDGPYVTTASDVGLLLEIIANGRLVDADGSDEAIRLLESRQAKSWLGEPLPWWARVAHKWGEVPGARHDAGIIFAQNSAYILVVLTEGVDANNSDDVIRNISRSVFGHFESAH
jgi:beta-lactamase class A